MVTCPKDSILEAVLDSFDGGSLYTQSGAECAAQTHKWFVPVEMVSFYKFIRVNHDCKSTKSY